MQTKLTAFLLTSPCCPNIWYLDLWKLAYCHSTCLPVPDRSCSGTAQAQDLEWKTLCKVEKYLAECVYDQMNNKKNIRGTYLLQGNPAVYIQQRHPGSSSMCDTHHSTFLVYTPLPSLLSPPVLLQDEHCHACSWWLECIIDNPTSIVCSWTRGNYISCLSKVWTALHFQWTKKWPACLLLYSIQGPIGGTWNDFHFKVAGNPEFSRSINLESKLIEFFALVNF